LLTFLFGEAKESKSPDKAKQNLSLAATGVKTTQPLAVVNKRQEKKA